MKNKDRLKGAFEKIKKDIFSLGEEIQELRKDLLGIKDELRPIRKDINKLKLKEASTHPRKTSTHNGKNFDTSTHPTSSKLSETQNLPFSTRNRGVSTDRQTNRQTNRQTLRQTESTKNKNLQSLGQKRNYNPQKKQYFSENVKNDDNIVKGQTSEDNKKDHLERANEILENLDGLKKELRIKIKRLTDQEMVVFSMLYNLEENGEIVDYKVLASKLNLSESSVRDYIGRLIKKNIPITKEKVNNKKIILHISSKLKRIASLSTIIKLRDL